MTEDTHLSIDEWYATDIDDPELQALVNEQLELDALRRAEQDQSNNAVDDQNEDTWLDDDGDLTLEDTDYESYAEDSQVDPQEFYDPDETLVNLDPQESYNYDSVTEDIADDDLEELTFDDIVSSTVNDAAGFDSAPETDHFQEMLDRNFIISMIRDDRSETVDEESDEDVMVPERQDQTVDEIFGEDTGEYIMRPQPVETGRRSRLFNSLTRTINETVDEESDEDLMVPERRGQTVDEIFGEDTGEYIMRPRPQETGRRSRLNLTRYTFDICDSDELVESDDADLLQFAEDEAMIREQEAIYESTIANDPSQEQDRTRQQSSRPIKVKSNTSATIRQKAAAKRDFVTPNRINRGIPALSELVAPVNKVKAQSRYLASSSAPRRGRSSRSTVPEEELAPAEPAPAEPRSRSIPPPRRGRSTVPGEIAAPDEAPARRIPPPLAGRSRTVDNLRTERSRSAPNDQNTGATRPRRANSYIPQRSSRSRPPVSEQRNEIPEVNRTTNSVPRIGNRQIDMNHVRRLARSLAGSSALQQDNATGAPPLPGVTKKTAEQLKKMLRRSINVTMTKSVQGRNEALKTPRRNTTGGGFGPAPESRKPTTDVNAVRASLRKTPRRAVKETKNSIKKNEVLRNNAAEIRNTPSTSHAYNGGSFKAVKKLDDKLKKTDVDKVAARNQKTPRRAVKETRNSERKKEVRRQKVAEIRNTPSAPRAFDSVQVESKKSDGFGAAPMLPPQARREQLRRVLKKVVRGTKNSEKKQEVINKSISVPSSSKKSGGFGTPPKLPPRGARDRMRRAPRNTVRGTKNSEKKQEVINKSVNVPSSSRAFEPPKLPGKKREFNVSKRIRSRPERPIAPIMEENAGIEGDDAAGSAPEPFTGRGKHRAARRRAAENAGNDAGSAPEPFRGRGKYRASRRRAEEGPQNEVPAGQAEAGPAEAEQPAAPRRVKPLLNKAQQARQAAIQRQLQQRDAPPPVVRRAVKQLEDEKREEMSDRGDGVILHSGYCDCPDRENSNCFSVRRYMGCVRIIPSFMMPWCCTPEDLSCKLADHGLQMVTDAAKEVEKMTAKTLKYEAAIKGYGDSAEVRKQVLAPLLEAIVLCRGAAHPGLGMRVNHFREQYEI